MTALYQHTASELAALVRTGAASCREIIDAHLARIEAKNPELNAVAQVQADAARARADALDQAARAGRFLGPLHGVPITVKESLDCAGSATTHGIPLLAHALPYLDAPAVARLRAAGAVVLGRGTTSELAMRLGADSPLRGRTYNPWNPRLTAGGSSGGDAAAVAAGLAPLALGADLGGSLRVPAACCGVATLKPTTGRVAHASSLPPEDFGAAGQLMFAPGPLARSVADLRLALGVLAGRDRRDPRSVNAPLVGAPLDEPRAALVTALPDGAPVPPAVAALVRAAGEALQAQGWAVEEVQPPELGRVGEIWHKLVATDLAATLALSTPLLSAELIAHLRRVCASANLEDSTNHRVHEERSRLGRAWSGFFEEYPVLITPALGAPPWAPDADLDPQTGLELIRRATAFALPANALGLPALGLPVTSRERPPQSLQVVADLWREDLCLQVGELLEAALGRVDGCWR